MRRAATAVAGTDVRGVAEAPGGRQLTGRRLRRRLGRVVEESEKGGEKEK